jgi:aspartyl protease family protein
MLLRPEGTVLIATLAALLAAGGFLRLNAKDLEQLKPTPEAARQGRAAKARDGHYWAMADVDGARVRFLVDTGSSAVALTEADAARIGLDVSRLTFDHPVATAGGGQEAASVVLHHIAVDGARVEEVRALVMRRGLPASLLGMSYLGRLSGFSAGPEGIILDR